MASLPEVRASAEDAVRVARDRDGAEPDSKVDDITQRGGQVGRCNLPDGEHDTGDEHAGDTAHSEDDDDEKQYKAAEQREGGAADVALLLHVDRAAETRDPRRHGEDGEAVPRQPQT